MRASVSVSTIWKAAAEKGPSVCSGPALPRARCPSPFCRGGGLLQRHWVETAWPRSGGSGIRVGSLVVVGHDSCRSLERVPYVHCGLRKWWDVFGSRTDLGNRCLHELVYCRDFRLLPTSVPGKSDEQRAAAALASVLCVQLGPGIESEEVLKTLGPILKKIICDGTASVQARQTVRPRFLSSQGCLGGTRWGHGILGAA